MIMSDKLAVITGGSKGIGRSLVERFCGEGYQVITCARNGAILTKELQDIGDRLISHSIDMSQKHEVLKFAEMVKSHGSQVDVLVNNVGVFIPGNIVDEPDGQLEKQIETNLYSAYYLTRFLLGEMDGGHIFNVCSTASTSPYENGSSYSISKYAMLGFSHNLREELKDKGIRVTAVLPGNTLTASWGETDIPEEKFIKSSDVAATIFNIIELSPYADIEQILIQPQFKRP